MVVEVDDEDARAFAAYGNESNPFLDKLIKNRAQEVLEGAIRRMQNRMLSKSWEQYQYWYNEVKDQHWKMSGAIRRMQNRLYSMAWERWQFWYADLLEQRHLLLVALKRMMQRALSMGWLRWKVAAQSQP